MHVVPSARPSRLLAAAVAGVLGIVALPAPAVAAAPQETAALGEVVVTSRRIEERLQDTPIAVSAFQEADLERLTIRNVGDVANFTPNFTSNPGPTGGSDAYYFIRGVGQTDLNPATDPGVATYVDGVYLGRVQGASIGASDIARIEVLRGPQGTLFGRNTVGGAINITTRDPGDAFGADVGASFGSRDLVQLRASVDVPLGENMGVLFSAGYRDQDGWGRRVSDGKIFDSNKERSARAKFKWDPSEGFGVTLTGDYTKLTGTPQHTILVGIDPRLVPNFGRFCASPGTPPGSPAFNAAAACSPLGVPLPTGMAQFANPADPYINVSDQRPEKDNRAWGTGLTLDFDLGWADLKSITSYRKLDQDQSTDYDSTPFSFYQGGFITAQKQWSQELQLAGETGRFRWLLGAFYYDENNEHTNVVSLGGNNGCFPFAFVPPTLGYPSCASIGAPYATPNAGRTVTNNQQFVLDVKAKALFGQTTIRLTDTLSTTLGLRWTDEEKQQNYNFWFLNGIANLGPLGGVANLAGFPPAGVLVGSPVGAGCPPNTEGRLYTLSPCSLRNTSRTSYDESWSKVTPKVGLEYKPEENRLYYFSYSQGFKSGGFAGRPSPDSGGNFVITAYDPEEMDSFELGAKTQFADDRVRLNVALFQSNYKGIQLLAINPTTGFFDTVNAAESRIRGAEVELVARPIPALEIQAGLGITDDEYQELAPSLALTGIADGMHLPLTSQINGSLGVQYTWLLGAGDLAVRGDYSYRSEYWYEAANSPLNRQGGFGLLNARATYSFGDGAWSLAVYGLNLTDKFYRTNVQDVIAAGLGVAFASVSAPREYGAELRYRFGGRR